MRTPVSLRKIYEAYRDEGEVGDLARTLLAQQDWFASVAEFDPRTSYALPLGLDEVLRRLASPTKTPYARDRLWRIAEHSRTSVERIFAALREDPRREQAVLPIRDVKELDAASFIALSRRPGRNIREKLAGKPYMQAVRRYQSVDLPENRLLKEYVTQLADFLELRATYLGHEDEILAAVYRWLRSDEAQAIGQWGNIPPNNTLLAHKDYRRVWDSWRALQTLDRSTDDDLKNLESRADTVAQWTQYANAYADGLAVFGDLPVLFDYDAFSITPWEGRPIVADARESPRKPRVRTPTVCSPVCVDLTTLHPRYSTDGATAAVMTESFVWQRWHGEQGVQDLELFEAGAAIVSPEATTLTWGDLTTVTDEISSDVIGAAALAFTRRLSATFMHPALITLVPDSTNDFQMETVRRHVNARFAQAEPLPRSIAAAIEQFDYSRIPRDGYQLVVVDTVGTVTSATKLTARHDPELATRVPQTRGFYWERAPHVALRSSEPTTSVLRQMLTVDDQEFWYDAVPTAPAEAVSVAALHRNTAVGTFDYVITVDESPVVGGMRLFNLQRAAGDIPLWRDERRRRRLGRCLGRGSGPPGGRPRHRPRADPPRRGGPARHHGTARGGSRRPGRAHRARQRRCAVGRRPRRRGAARAHRGHRLLELGRGRRLLPRRRDGAAEPPVRVRGRPGPLARGRDRRRADPPRRRRARAGPVLGAAGREGELRRRHRPRGRARAGAHPARRGPRLRRGGRRGGAALVPHVVGDPAGPRERVRRPGEPAARGDG